MAVNEYTKAIKKLFPQGAYWDSLLKNSKSDLNKTIDAKANSLLTYRLRVMDLKKEAFLNTCNETIADYERAYLDSSNAHLSLQQRKSLLKAQKNGQINIKTLKNLAKIYEAEIFRISCPFTEYFFAHSFFGDFMASPAAKNVVFIHAQAPKAVRADFENAIESTLFAFYIIYFFYRG